MIPYTPYTNSTRHISKSPYGRCPGLFVLMPTEDLHAQIPKNA
jgi:hypothetical protein